MWHGRDFFFPRHGFECTISTSMDVMNEPFPPQGLTYGDLQRVTSQLLDELNNDMKKLIIDLELEKTILSNVAGERSNVRETIMCEWNALRAARDSLYKAQERLFLSQPSSHTTVYEDLVEYFGP